MKYLVDVENYKIRPQTLSDQRRLLRVGFIGTRGVPNTYGGFERFIEQLVENPIWLKNNIQFIVYGEGESLIHNPWTKLVKIDFKKSSYPFLYYIASCIKAARDCDVIICCGVGLSFLSFWPRIFRKILILNPDGCEWRRVKWSIIGRLFIRAMYFPALLFANYLVIDAESLREDFGLIIKKKTCYIGYQAPDPGVSSLSTDVIESMSLSKPFILVIARLEPENNIKKIIDAFIAVNDDSTELIIIGGTNTLYFSKKLVNISDPCVRFIGALYEQNILAQLRSNCAAYVHGHSVGGTNPSLLEALASVRGFIFCHDNKYNREVAEDEASYFDTEIKLQDLLKKVISKSDIFSVRTPTRDERFSPDFIAQKYLNLFEDIRATNKHI